MTNRRREGTRESLGPLHQFFRQDAASGVVGVQPVDRVGNQQPGRPLPVQRTDRAQPEQGDHVPALQTALAPIFIVLIILAVIGFVFATFGGAALIHLINQLELRERATLGKGLDGGEKIFQLLSVRVILLLPNLLVVLLAFAVMWGQLSRIDLTSAARANPLSGLFSSFCGIMAITFVVNLLTSALSVGAERAIVIEKL